MEKVMLQHSYEYVGEVDGSYLVETAEGYEYTDDIEQATPFETIQSCALWITEIGVEFAHIHEVELIKTRRVII